MPKVIIGASHALNCAQALGTFHANWEQACTDLIPIDGFDGQRHYFIYQTPQTPFLGFRRTAGAQPQPVIGPLFQRLRAFNRPDVELVLLVGGNEHSAAAFCEHDVPWDFHLTGDEELDPSRQVLALSAVRRLLQLQMWMVEASLSVITREFTHTRRSYVCPPPPIPSLDHIKKNPEVFDFERHPVAPARFRMKVYRVFVALLEQICRERSIAFLPPPAEACDADGFLIEAMWAGCTHAQPSFYSSLFRAVEAA